jgi:hypothetical protein
MRIQIRNMGENENFSRCFSAKSNISRENFWRKPSRKNFFFARTFANTKIFAKSSRNEILRKSKFSLIFAKMKNRVFVSTLPLNSGGQ